ncbi:MAG: BTAD domain-containing putative transcriptional regulator [Clostridia bacterium]|jgi:DNA-binding SARP family transcriptional activator|nr:BTAD domain-containing putative transcriptional regulator [Clostridia bacterium]
MNAFPVLKSKLIMPELPPHFLLTERMKKLHAAMDTSRVVSICAPAGYGKTTLAVSYFHRRADRSARICWYRLDPEDANLPVFIAHLAETLFPPATPRFAESRKALRDYADVELQPRSAIAMLCQEMWSHHSGSDNIRTYLVLDDFQNVVGMAEIGDMIRFLLDNMPPSCILFVLSRPHHAVFSEKQKLEQKVLEIGAEDLVFSQAEINDFMLQMDPVILDRQLAGWIRKKTEGWIAGIAILYQAFKSKGLDLTGLASGKKDHAEALFRYLSLEVFKSVEDGTQDGLVRLALLQEFTAEEAAQICGIADIKPLIDRSTQFGLFIQRIQDDPVVYRFHALFREFLLHILKSRLSGEEIAGLHLQAAAYYIARGAYIRAAEHLAQGGNTPLAAELVNQAGFNKFLIGETAQLKLWLDLLPEEMVRNNPVLLLFQAQLLPNSRQGEMVEPLKELLRQCLRENKPEMYFHGATVLIYILTCRNDMKELRAMATGLSWQPDAVSEELKNTLIILDMVRSIGEERFSEGEAYSESVLYALLPEDSQWLYLILSCIIYYSLGKLAQAERCMNTALALDNFKNIEPARGFILLFLAITLALKHDKERLPGFVAEITAIGEKYDYDYLSAGGRRVAAFERYLSFDTESAVEMLDYAVFHHHRMYNKVMGASCRLLQRLWSIRPGVPGPDLAQARREASSIRKARPGMMVAESSLSILGALAREAGDFALAERSLLSAVRLAKAKKGSQTLCGALFHLARLYYAQEDREKGLRYLRQAMELAANNKYYMFWDIHLPTLTEMALRSIRCGCRADFAEELLGRFYDGNTVRYLAEKVKSMDENRIATYVDDFVFRYKPDQAEPLYFIKAALFGKPQISVNGVKIPEAEWKTKKIKGLLEYLLLNSGKTASKDKLSDIFWPEADNKSALASLRTALYQLRKTLAKYQVPVTGSRALIHETLGGLQIKNEDVWELDYLDFLRLHQKLAALSKADPEHEDKRLGLLRQMVSLYQGELMEDSDYGELVFLERERCKMIFEEACLELGFIYTERGELSQAEETLRRALILEPYSENICLELLKLFIRQGRRSKAVNLYYRFKKRFEQEFDVRIEQRLTEAIRNPERVRA